MGDSVLPETFSLKDLEKLNIEFKNSSYRYNGTVVPRVTDILSKTIHEDYLMIWANRLGFKRQEYKDTLQAAADCGSMAHKMIEDYLQNDVDNDYYVPFLAFKEWWKTINTGNNVSILGEEESLVCQWFGGTYDLLLDINGQTFLVDFKTSNHISFKYFLQLAAYRNMLYTLKGINIDGCIILKLDKDDISFDEYVLDFKIDEHYQFIETCTRTFFSLVYAYYQTSNARNMYSSIF